MGPAFDYAEHQGRLRRSRAALRAAGLDGCICVAPEHLYYIAGYDAHTHFSEQALVFTVDDDEPTLVLRDVDLPLAHETSWVKDIRLYHFAADNPAAMVAAVAAEKGLKGKRIGTDLQSYAMPAAYGRRLATALHPSILDDSTEIVGKLRCIKSPAEMVYIREAAKYARLGMDTVARCAKPGMTETQLAAEIDYAMRSVGSDYPAMPTWVASGQRTAAGHSLPVNRVMSQGDLLHVECAGVARRYHCVSMQTFCFGPPSARIQAICTASRESALAGRAAIRIGEPVAAAEVASLGPMEAHNLRQHALMRFGLGISAGYPPSWLEPLYITAGSNDVFADGMVFYIHSCLEIPAEGLGTLMGGSYALTQSGLEQLDSAVPQLIVL